MSIVLLDLGMTFDWEGQPEGNEVLKWDALIADDHDYLFRFLDADLSKLEEIIHEYLGCLAEKKQGNYDTLIAIHEQMAQLHPYFKKFPLAIDMELNRIFADYVKHTYANSETDEQIRMLRLLVSAEHIPLSNLDLEAILDSDDSMGSFRLADLQRDLRRWVFITLDDTNPVFAGMTTAQRNALYYLTDRNQFTPVLETGIQYSIRPTKRMRHMMAVFDFDFDAKYFSALWDLKDMADHPDDEVPEGFQEVLDAVSDVVEDCSTLTYEIADLRALLSLEIFDMSQKGLRIKRCADCRKYFVISGGNERYCNRVPDGATKTCREKHSATSTAPSVLTRIVDPATATAAAIQAAYRKAYKTHYARIKAGTMTEKDFADWKAIAINMKETVAAGEMALEAYEEWLKK